MIYEMCNQEKKNVFGKGCGCNAVDGIVKSEVSTPLACSIYCCELLSAYTTITGWTWIDDATGRTTVERCDANKLMQNKASGLDTVAMGAVTTIFS